MKMANKGFTLIELMVVVAILAVISAIAIPAYTGYIKAAKMSEAQNNLAALRLAQEEFFLDNNTYFVGGDTKTIEANSQGLWTAAKGSDGNVNFDYVVTPTNGWTATAKGNSGSVSGEILTASK